MKSTIVVIINVPFLADVMVTRAVRVQLVQVVVVVHFKMVFSEVNA